MATFETTSNSSLIHDSYRKFLQEEPHPKYANSDVKIAGLRAQISQLTFDGENEETIGQKLRLQDRHISLEAQATGWLPEVAKLKLIRRGLIYRRLGIRASVQIISRISEFGFSAVKAAENVLKHFALGTPPKRYTRNNQEMPSCLSVRHPDGAIVIDRQGACNLKNRQLNQRGAILSEVDSYFNPHQQREHSIVAVTQNKGSLDRAQREILFTEFFQGPGVVELVGKTQPMESGYSTYFKRKYDGSLEDLLYSGTISKKVKHVEAIYALEPVIDALIRMEQWKIVHRNLNPANIFIDQDGRGRLTGFDSCIEMGSGDTEEEIDSQAGYAFIPPEYYSERNSNHYHVWSLGMLLCEIFEIEHRFVVGIPESQRAFRLSHLSKEDEADYKMPDYQKDPFGYLIYWCTRLDPEERFSLNEVKDFMVWIFNKYCIPESSERKENIPPPESCMVRKKRKILPEEVDIAG